MKVEIISATECKTKKGKIYKIQGVVIGYMEETKNAVIQPLSFKDKRGDVVTCFNFKLHSIHEAEINNETNQTIIL